MYFYFVRGSKTTAIDSLAVLPFVNVGADPNTEYLSDGITDNIINRLSQLPNLKVMSHSSVFRYKGKETDAPAIRRDLGVAAVLTGRVVQRGDDLSINVELVDARDNSHIWGEQYDRKIADVLVLQREIPVDISEKLSAIRSAIRSGTPRKAKSNRLIIYESWDLMSVSVPPRSRLYNLEAIGIGTGSVECLTSYVSRLAAAHCLSPAVLLGRTLAPLMGKKYWLQGGARPGTRGSALGHSFSTHAKAVNGTGVIAKDWVRVIEGLTMRNDLRFLTMLPWANALTCRHLLRPTRAWCPTCYGEWRANEQIVYAPMLWAFCEVQVCLRHQRRLRFQCNHCARNLPWLGRRTLPGHCSKCGNWLGVDFSGRSTDVTPADDELAWQTCVMKNLEEMIVAATHLPSPPKERITKALSLCIDQVTEGIMNRFACLIGKRKNTVWGWQHGKAKIPMGDLLRICDRVGVSLVDFLYTEFVTQNEVEMIPARFPFSGVTTTRRRPRPFDREFDRARTANSAQRSPASSDERSRQKA